MSSIALWFLIAVFLDRVYIQISAFSYGSVYCGIGAMDMILQRRIKAPMAYRVLVPFTLGAIETVAPRLKQYRGTLYEMFKIVALTATLALCEMAVGRMATFLIAAILPVTMTFDYWCWIIELGAFAAALTGNMQLAIIGGVLLAMSRETAPFVGVTYALITYDWIGAGLIEMATLGTMLWVRLWVGRRPMYCDRFMFRRNIRELREMIRRQPLLMDYSVGAVLITALVIAVVLTGNAGAAWPIPLAIVGICWAMGLVREIRIFTPALLWLAMGVLR